jgi:hypothetical protein
VFNIRKFFQGLGIVPKATTSADTAGEMEVLSSDNRLRYHDGTSVKVVTLNDSSDTLTNKTINADSNTITNIENADIKAGAAIDAAKIANGTVSNAEFQALDGVTSSIQTQLNATASSAALTAHIDDTTDAHDASAISNVPAGNLVATDVQAALNELQTDVDTRATSSALTTHTGASTGVHGVTGAVVGTTDAQSLSSKTMSDSLTFTQIATPSNPSSGKNALYPKADGKFYNLNAAGVETELGAGSGGDVVGPASSTDNAIARFDLATGKLIQNSVVTVGDTGIIAGATLPAASASYTPTTPANWQSVPTQVQQALDNLAANKGGVKNYIQNPNARADATTGVTYTNVTSGRDATGGLFEGTNFSFTINSATDVVSFAADAFDPYLQNTGLCQAEFTWTADANGENVQAQVFRNGAVIGQKNLYTTGSTSPATASIAFLCGDLVNATTFRIVGTAATATALKLSQVKLTEAQWSKDSVGSTYVGSVSTPTQANCNWVRTSTDSFADFAADTDCIIQTADGSVLAPTTKKPAVRLDLDPQYIYHFEASGFFAGSNAVDFAWRFSDGTDSSEVSMNNMGNAGTGNISGTIRPSRFVSNAEVNMQCTGSQVSGTCNILAANGLRTLTIKVWRSPRDQAVVNLRAQSGDYDEIRYTPTTNLGTLSNTNFSHRRDKEMLAINGYTDIGTGGAGSAAQIGLPGNLTVAAGTARRMVGRISWNFNNTSIYCVMATGGNSYLTIAQMNATGGCSTDMVASSLNSTGMYFEADNIPIQGWTKSNTAVNIAGEPGAYSAAHGNDCLFARANAAIGDPTADASCTFTEKQNGNFGTVTSALSGADKLPGIVHTPKLTGRYFVIATFPQYNASSANNDFSLTDGTNVIATGAQGLNSGSQTNMMTLSGVYSGVAGTPLTLKIQSAASAGTINIGSPGLSSGNAINWTIFPITQNLPGLLGGAGIAPRSSVRVQAGNGRGSTNTSVRRWSTVLETTGSDITYADSATLGGSFTINSGGIFSISASDRNESGSFESNITKNDTTAALASNVLRYFGGASSFAGAGEVTLILQAGDVIRLVGTAANNTGVASGFTITKIGN